MVKRDNDYISLDNPIMAKKVVEGIYKKVQILKLFSKIGYRYENDENGVIRILLYGHYRIAYLIKNKERIDILGVVHSSIAI